MPTRQRILVPLDFSDVTDLVVKNAKLIAKLLDAELKIIHVVSPMQDMGVQATRGVGGVFVEPIDYGSIRDELAKDLKSEHKNILAIKQKLTEENIKVKTSILEGRVSDLVLSQVEEYDPDMIIMGSHGHGYLKKALLGSITMFVLKHVKCPVMVIPSDAKRSIA